MPKGASTSQIPTTLHSPTIARTNPYTWRSTTFGGNWTLKQVTFDTVRPNGVLLSADQQTLYVADSHPDDQFCRELRAYGINTDGTLGKHHVLFDFGVGPRHRRHDPHD